MNIINLRLENTQHYLDWGAAFAPILAFFKEIQALGWLNFVTGANLLPSPSPCVRI